MRESYCKQSLGMGVAPDISEDLHCTTITGDSGRNSIGLTLSGVQIVRHWRPFVSEVRMILVCPTIDAASDIATFA